MGVSDRPLYILPQRSSPKADMTNCNRKEVESIRSPCSEGYQGMKPTDEIFGIAVAVEDVDSLVVSSLSPENIWCSGFPQKHRRMAHFRGTPQGRISLLSGLLYGAGYNY
jgi:hypothetical protein